MLRELVVEPTCFFITLAMLNKLKMLRPLLTVKANQISRSWLSIQIHILHDKQYRSRSVGFSSEANWSGSTLFAETYLFWFSRTRVNYFGYKWLKTTTKIGSVSSFDLLVINQFDDRWLFEIFCLSFFSENETLCDSSVRLSSDLTFRVKTFHVNNKNKRLPSDLKVHVTLHMTLHVAWHFMWIICLADDSHETSRLIFAEK